MTSPRHVAATTIRVAAIVGTLALATSGCGDTRNVPGPTRSDAVATISAALPDIQPANPADGVKFDKLLKACLSVVHLDQRERRATSPSLSKTERSHLHEAATDCTSDSAHAHALLEAITSR